MHLFILALALGIFVHDGLRGDGAGPFQPGSAALLAAVVLPKLALAGLYALSCHFVRNRLATPRGRVLVRRLDRGSELYRYLVLALYALDLYLGLLVAVRQAIGNIVLLDELLVMLPTLAMMLWAWWAYHPVDRRLREGSLIGRIDAGLPVYPIWTRGQYLLSQVRHQVLIILVPLLLIMAWGEAVHAYGPTYWAAVQADPRPALVGLGTLTVFLFAPVMLRFMWDTTPLPAGEIRHHLTALCHRHGIRVRELLLWRTLAGGGGMINAAVMGIVAPLRYILLTDALLDSLDKDEVEAVMAHELGHVRRHHMFWLLAAAVGALGLLELAAYGLLMMADGIGVEAAPVVVAGWSLDMLGSPEVVVAGVGGVAALTWVVIFGWVSRRFERQADTFAVQSIATGRAEPGTDPRRAVIDGRAVATMTRALGRIAELNGISPNTRSWRHGSIGWRQAHLQTLVGQRVDQLFIDRQIRWIKLAAAVAVVTAVGAVYLLPAVVIG